MLWKKKRKNTKVKKNYDPAKQTPILHCSICNGEQVAGFRNNETGQFEEVMFIRNDADLERFKEAFGITEKINKEY